MNLEKVFSRSIEDLTPLIANCLKRSAGLEIDLLFEDPVHQDNLGFVSLSTELDISPFYKNSTLTCLCYPMDQNGEMFIDVRLSLEFYRIDRSLNPRIFRLWVTDKVVMYQNDCIEVKGAASPVQLTDMNR